MPKVTTHRKSQNKEPNENIEIGNRNSGEAEVCYTYPIISIATSTQREYGNWISLSHCTAAAVAVAVFTHCIWIWICLSFGSHQSDFPDFLVNCNKKTFVFAYTALIAYMVYDYAKVPKRLVVPIRNKKAVKRLELQSADTRYT